MSVEAKEMFSAALVLLGIVGMALGCALAQDYAPAAFTVVVFAGVACAAGCRIQAVLERAQESAEALSH